MDITWTPEDRAAVYLYATDETDRYFAVNGVEPSDVVRGVNAFTREEWELVFVKFTDI